MLEDILRPLAPDGKRMRYLDVAYHTGLAEATIRNWAKGRAAPTVNVVELRKVLDFLDVSFEEFTAATTRTIKAKWLEIFTKDKRNRLIKLAEDLKTGVIKPSEDSKTFVKTHVFPILGLKDADYSGPVWEYYGSCVWEEIKADMGVLDYQETSLASNRRAEGSK